MLALIDSLQRIAATVLVAGLYLLPATLGGLMDQLDVDLEAVTSPERVASFVLDLPAGASIPMLVEDDPLLEAVPRAPKPEPDRLGVKGGVPIASRQVATRASSKPSSKERARGQGKAKQQERCMASTGQVSATGGSSYRVERALLDYYFGHTDEAAKLGSAAWYRDEGGDIEGIRVRRVRCGSPVEEAGIKQGDIIRTANGKRVDSMAGVIALWWQLRTKDRLELRIIRDGHRKRLVYSLV
jgi:hypothetical protein